MTAGTTCSELSLANAEPLAGTATQGADWLLVEVRGSWGRDAVEDSGLAESVRERLAAYPGKVVLIRRPDRTVGTAVIRADVGEVDGSAIRYDFDSLADLAAGELTGGTVIGGPVFLVCAHGRRDACCARLGAPLFRALADHVPPERLWQASHLGGHRFAPNVVVLPHGIQLGRIPLDRVEEVVDLVSAGRIPLDLYRGRTVYVADAQVAEARVRAASGRDRVTDVTLISSEGDRLTFRTPAEEFVVRVERQPGTAVVPSCGAEPEPAVCRVARIESAGMSPSVPTPE